jgi:uncharacterized damage-inducible protein DinB
MKESVVKALVNGLYGKNTHCSPKKAIEGLTPTTARIKPENDYHSCWESVHHIVVWQDAIIEALKGNQVDWQNISKNKNWPNAEYLSDDDNFTQLVKKFEDGLTQTEKMLKNIDLHKPMPSWGDNPNIQAVIVLLQHNSYHIGQIVAVRKILGI